MAEPEKFQHYEVQRKPDGSLYELGRGAMGVTYKAFDTNLRIDVALKVISPAFLGSDVARQRFLREARSAAALRHANVASVFHLGNEGDTCFYAMEFVEGETVDARLRREGPLPVRTALEIALQVTRALTAADKQKLVHRDLKPSNIMLQSEDDGAIAVKVIDFGLAKAVDKESAGDLTLTQGGFLGTPPRSRGAPAPAHAGKTAGPPPADRRTPPGNRGGFACRARRCFRAAADSGSGG